MRLAEFVSLVQRSSQHRTLYHFTDTANLPSIAASGLLSKTAIHARGVIVEKPGGNDWSRDADEIKGLSDYVNLCLTRNHPMSSLAIRDKRISNVTYLEIDPRILLEADCRFTLGVANRRGEIAHEFNDWINQADLEVLYQRTNWADPEVNKRLRVAEKYEILVPQQVARRFIVAR